VADRVGAGAAGAGAAVRHGRPAAVYL